MTELRCLAVHLECAVPAVLARAPARCVQPAAAAVHPPLSQRETEAASPQAGCLASALLAPRLRSAALRLFRTRCARQPAAKRTPPGWTRWHGPAACRIGRAASSRACAEVERPAQAHLRSLLRLRRVRRPSPRRAPRETVPAQRPRGPRLPAVCQVRGAVSVGGNATTQHTKAERTSSSRNAMVVLETS